MWSIINKISGNDRDKTNVISCFRDGAISYNSPKEIATIFNDHFSSIGRKFSNAITNSIKHVNEYISTICRNNKSCYLEPMSLNEVLRVIENLPNKKSSEFDQLDNVLLKELKYLLAKRLSKLFN